MARSVISLTPAAVERLRHLIATQGGGAAGIKLGVKTAGCSGLTYTMDFAREVSDRVLFLHDGLVDEEGSPEQVFTAPGSERCRQFLAKYLK